VNSFEYIAKIWVAWSMDPFFGYTSHKLVLCRRRCYCKICRRRIIAELKSGLN